MEKEFIINQNAFGRLRVKAINNQAYFPTEDLERILGLKNIAGKVCKEDCLAVQYDTVKYGTRKLLWDKDKSPKEKVLVNECAFHVIVSSVKSKEAKALKDYVEQFLTMELRRDADEINKQVIIHEAPCKVIEERMEVFQNPAFGNVKVATGDKNEPLFCLADVCKCLGIENNRNVKSRLFPAGVHTIYTRAETPTKGIFKNAMLFVNEPNLYRCIFQSKKKEALQFQNWVFEEVLPSIRRSGQYVNPDYAQRELIKELAASPEKTRRFLLELKSRGADVEVPVPLFSLTETAEDMGFPSVFLFARTLHLAGALKKDGETPCKGYEKYFRRGRDGRTMLTEAGKEWIEKKFA